MLSDEKISEIKEAANKKLMSTSLNNVFVLLQDREELKQQLELSQIEARTYSDMELCSSIPYRNDNVKLLKEIEELKQQLKEAKEKYLKQNHEFGQHKFEVKILTDAVIKRLDKHKMIEQELSIGKTEANMLLEEIRLLKQQLSEARAVIEFYADITNLYGDYDGHVLEIKFSKPGNTKAREYLKKYGEEK